MRNFSSLPTNICRLLLCELWLTCEKRLKNGQRFLSATPDLCEWIIQTMKLAMPTIDNYRLSLSLIIHIHDDQLLLG